jgi:hypothetical protein
MKRQCLPIHLFHIQNQNNLMKFHILVTSFGVCVAAIILFRMIEFYGSVCTTIVTTNISILTYQHSITW